MKNNVLILDDDFARAQRWESQLSGLFKSIGLDWNVLALGPNDLESAIRNLVDRRVASRKTAVVDAKTNPIDEAGVIIVDYDLLNLDTIGQFITGDDVAYLARCYSTCGAIVGLNQFDKRGPSFDLTLLGHPKEFADVHINAALINNVGLWSQDHGDTFRPWSWPVLPDLVAKIDESRQYLVENLDELALKILGLSNDEITSLPTRATAYLEYDASSEDDNTVSQPKPLVNLLVRDIANTRPGLRGRDKLPSDAATANLIESRLRLWLDGVVLPEQQILVDIPHLVERLPGSLIDPARDDLWTRACNPTSAAIDVLKPEIRDFVLQSPLYVRPAIQWRRLASNSDLMKKIVQESAGVARRCFAEDTSEFCTAEQVSEFLSDLELSNPRRYVKQVSNVDYQPATNLALA